MKRIIEIDESLYNRIRDRMAILSDIPSLCGLVAGSEPYNPTGDAISREAVEKVAVGMLEKWGDGYPYIEIPTGDAIKEMKSAIDNLGAMSEAGKHDRPKGEWYYGEDECGQDGWFCSECNFFVPWYYQYYEKDINFIRDYKACPHCLAEMITYTGKDRDTKGGEEE